MSIENSPEKKYEPVYEPVKGTWHWFDVNHENLMAHADLHWPEGEDGMRRSVDGIEVVIVDEYDPSTFELPFRQQRECDRYTWEVYGRNYQMRRGGAERLLRENIKAPPETNDPLLKALFAGQRPLSFDDQIFLSEQLGDPNSPYLWDDNEFRMQPNELHLYG